VQVASSPAEAAEPLGHARRWPTVVATVVAFGALTCWLYPALVFERHTGVVLQTALPLEQSDQLLHAWILDWVYHQLARRPWALFDAGIFWPHPYSLALSDHLFGVAVTLAPLHLVVEEPLRLLALGTALMFPLAALAMWALVFSLTRDAAASLVAGVLWAFNPFRTHNLDQIQLLTDYAIPLAFLVLHRWQRDGRGRQLVALAAVFAWQVLCSAYLGAFLAVPLGIAFGWGLVRGRPPVRPGAGWWLAAAAVGALMLGPFLYPYVHLQSVFDLRQHMLNSIGLSLSLRDLACVRGCTSLAGPIVGASLVLAVVALWPGAGAGSGVRTPYVVAAASGVLLSLGPYVHVAPAFGAGSPEFVAPGPYLFLQKWVPGFDGLRAPARAIVLWHFGIAALAGLGTARLRRAVAAVPVRAAVTVVALAAAVVQAGRPALRFVPVPGTAEAPAVYRWLAAHGDGPIVEIPPRAGGAAFTYWTTVHHRPLVNGYSGILPLSYRLLEAALVCYPCPEALAALADLGVRTHLVHLENVAPPWRERLRARIAAEPSLAVERAIGGTLVGRVAPPARPPAAGPPWVALDRGDWTATSSLGPRDVARAFDGSEETAWSTGPALDALDRPRAGLALLRGLGTGQDIRALMPRGDAWLQVDLGSVAPVRRVTLAFSDWAGQPAAPAPALAGSVDGTTWVPLDAVPRVVPSWRELVRRGRVAHVEYDVPTTPLRFLRVRDAGYWSLHDLAVYR
jgi:hypothetical protein